MCDFTPYLRFIAVSLMIALSPGPSWAYTISTTLGHGRKAGIVHTHLILFSSGIYRRLKKSGKVQKALRWATETVFLACGARLALTDR